VAEHPAGEVRVVDDVAAAFAAEVVRAAPRALALSGGGTAERCYRALAAAEGIDWPSVTVVIGDERFVPVEHPDSNEGMARRVLLDAVPVGSVRSARGAGADPATAAAAYDAVVAGLQPLDLVHLGLGEDGHTASLFPGSPALDERDRQVVATGDDLHPWPRLTLTYPALAAARRVVVTVEGEAKRRAWAGVRAGDRDLPATRLGGDGLLWLVDRAAAG
jgi:6-phosphogluconolactonase